MTRPHPMPDIANVPLFLPVTRLERLEKAAASGADAVILDLEDAVAPSEKEKARLALSGIAATVPLILRVNAADTVWHAEDLAAARDLAPAAVMLPKAEPGPALRAAIAALAGIPIIALVETARGLAGAREIVSRAGVLRLAFGSIDYCADLNCAHDQQVLLPARSELVLASRLACIPAPLDGVTAETRDLDLAAADAAHARALGMGGKMVIHPAQVAPVARAFRPTDAEIDWARRVLAAPEGVSTLDGAMLDAPVRARAGQILARVKQNAE